MRSTARPATTSSGARPATPFSTAAPTTTGSKATLPRIAYDGGEGRDILEGSPDQADVLRGGPGRDAADYGNHARADTVTLDGTADDGADGEGDNVLTDVEDVFGTEESDILTGGATANLLDGRAGDDRLSGLGGDDDLRGGAGGDVLEGHAGKDGYTGGAGNDILNALDGIAEIVDCGADDDSAENDPFDVLIGCEEATS